MNPRLLIDGPNTPGDEPYSFGPNTPGDEPYSFGPNTPGDEPYQILFLAPTESEDHPY